MKEAGFSDVRRHITSSDRDLRDRVRYSITSVGALIAILKAQARNGANGALGDADIEDAGRDMLKDVASGAYHRIDVVQFMLLRQLNGKRIVNFFAHQKQYPLKLLFFLRVHETCCVVPEMICYSSESIIYTSTASSLAK